MNIYESQDEIDNDESNEDSSSAGEIKVVKTESNLRMIYFVPPDFSAMENVFGPKKARKSEILISKIDAAARTTTLYPFKTFEEYDDYLEPKYQNIKELVVDWNGDTLPEDDGDVIDIFENLPPGLIKNFRYGFGLQRDYRFIIHSLEKMDDISKLFILAGPKTENRSHENTFVLNLSDYNEIRKEINRITRNSQRVARGIKTFNVDEMLQKSVYENAAATIDLKGEVSEINQLVESSLAVKSRAHINNAQKKAVELIAKSSAQIFQKNPESLIKLHQNIELVTLEGLIEKFESMIERAVSESAWQKLFTNNPFILSLAFGFPVMLVQSQAYVGGGRVQGDGEKIADFLIKTRSTNNAAIFEIKTPQTKLVRSKAFREGVHGPSSDLSDSINQVSDQINKLLLNIYAIKVNSKLFDLESYSVQGVLVIGHTPSELDRKKSLDLFRANIKNINILTFDELLEKLRQLHHFLSAAQ